MQCAVRYVCVSVCGMRMCNILMHMTCENIRWQVRLLLRNLSVNHK